MENVFCERGRGGGEVCVCWGGEVDGVGEEGGCEGGEYCGG